jgi:hypothetical protein
MTNYVMLMLTESGGEKNGIAFSIASDSLDAGSDEEIPARTEELSADNELYDFNLLYEKTGRTKTIAGYPSEEYILENEEGRTEYWFSRGARFDFSSAYNYIGGFQALSTAGGAFSGILMEMNHIDKVTKNRAKMIVNDISPNSPNTIELKDFSILSFGGDRK